MKNLINKLGQLIGIPLIETKAITYEEGSEIIANLPEGFYNQTSGYIVHPWGFLENNVNVSKEELLQGYRDFGENEEPFLSNVKCKITKRKSIFEDSYELNCDNNIFAKTRLGIKIPHNYLSFKVNYKESRRNKK